MKRLMCIGVLTCLLVAGCGSPTMDAWADRGIQGVEFGKQNVTEFQDKFQRVLDLRNDSDLDAFFEDILRVGTGQVAGVILDEQWVMEHKQALRVLLALQKMDRVSLDDAAKEALGNLDQITEAFEQIKRLRKTWGSDDEVQAQIDRLTAIIDHLVKTQQSK